LHQILVEFQLFYGGCCALPCPLIFHPLSSLAPCGGDEEWVCGARDGVPADVLEPYLSSCPSGQAFLRLSKPLMAMAYAVETRDVFFSSSLLQWSLEWRSMAEERPWLETTHCGRLAPDGLLCIVFICWGCLCKCVRTAVVVVSSGVCACHVLCMS
jgi:hypothetical protein